jgi:hypothetical protein
MKKVLEAAAAKNKLQTAYSGSSRIMYLKGDDETIREFIKQARINYPNLAFELKNGNQREDFNKIAEKESKGSPSLSVFSGNDVDEKLAEKVANDAYETVFGPGNPLLSDEAGQADFTGEKKKPTPEEVDAYLLEHPVDRKAKGPYNAAAAHFGVKPNYIRVRWARLREQGKVEKELQTENA